MASQITDKETILDSSHYNAVVPACKKVAARWRDLGTELGIFVHTLDSIHANHDTVERRMGAMIEKWLERPLGDVHDEVKPTWRSLCVALSHIDRALADRLAEEHNCGDISMSVKVKGKREVFAESSVQMSKPTIQELDQYLKDLVKWQRFAIHLPGIDQTQIEIIEKNKHGDIVEQKLALYKTWLQVYPNASWDDVVQALEKADENSIASNLRAKFPMLQTAKQPEAIEEVRVEEDMVEELDKLHASFISLTVDVKRGIESGVEQGNMSTESLVRHTEELRAFEIKELQSVKTTDDFFRAIKPHYNFLDCYLIVSLAMLLSGSIATRANEYSDKVRMFMRTTKVNSLQKNLKHYYQIARTHTNNIFVRITVENVWGNQSIWFVKTLVQRLFPATHPDENQWFDVVPG